MFLVIFYSFTFFSMIISLLLLIWDLKRRSPFFLLWATILILILIPSLYDPFNRVILPHAFASTLYITDDMLLEHSIYSFFILISFLFLYIILHQIFPQRETIYLNNVVKSHNNVYLPYLILLCTSLLGFYKFYENFGSSIFHSFDFTTRRETSSLLESVLLSYPFMICCGLGCFFFLNKKLIYLFIFIFFYLFLYFVLGGSRQPIIAAILPFLFYYCIGKNKLNKKLIIIFFLGSFLANFFFDGLIYLRNLESFDARIEALSNPIELIFNISNRDGSELNVRYAFYYFLGYADTDNGYFGFSYLLRTLLFFLPSSLDIFQIKPEDFEYKMFYDYMNGKNGTMHPTIFGSIYADSGWNSIPWVIFLGFILYFLPIYIQRFKGAVYFCIWSTCVFYSLMIARGSIYASIVVISSAILFGFFVEKMRFKLGVK